jgi:hypothetical protein
MLAWIFFRADSLTLAFRYTSNIFNLSLFLLPTSHIDYLPIIAIMIAIEWLQRDKQHALQFDNVNIGRSVRWGVYYTLIFSIFLYGGEQQQFIYFQF